MDAALERRGRGASGPRVRRVPGGRPPHHPRDRASRRCRASAAKGAPIVRRARRASRRSRAASWSGCAIAGRSRWCRCRRTGRSRVVIAGDFVTPRTARGSCTWRRRSAPTTTAPGSEHGLALVRPVAADGTFTGTTLARDRGPARHRRGDQRAHHPAAQAGRPLAPDDRAATRTPIRTAGAATSQLIYYARDSWFVRTSAVKERMLELNRAGRLASARGRARAASASGSRTTSTGRSRATATGARRSRCGSATAIPTHVEVIGSYAELARAVGPAAAGGLRSRTSRSSTSTPGRAPGGGTMRRAPEVIDTWFDSGAMPYAQWHYPFEHEAEFQAHFPADFICEGVDQTRGLVLLAARDRDDGVRRARPTGTSS